MPVVGGSLPLLVVCLWVVYVRYALATFMSPFFSAFCAARGIGSSFAGIVFAVYPLGIAVTGVWGAPRLLRWGTRRAVVLGLATTASATLLFGYLPDLCGCSGDADGGCRSALLRWTFVACYFVNGLVGSLSDNGVIVVCGEAFKARSGLVMTLVCTVSGLGSMSGPPLGGTLYSAFGEGAAGFSATCTVFAGLSLATVPLAWCGVPEERVNGSSASPEERAALLQSDDGVEVVSAPGVRDVLTASSALSLGGIFIGGVANGSLDPTLALRLADLSPATVGLFFTVSSLTYTVAALPVGWATEWTKTRERVGDSRAYKLGLSAGFVLMGGGFALLGPLGLPGVGTARCLDSHTAACIGMFLKGVGGAGNNCVYPDLLLDLPTGDGPRVRAAQAKVDGLWNAIYALGWAAGPAFGGGVYSVMGFPGMASVVAMLLCAYAAVLQAAAWSAWGTGGFRRRAPQMQGAREAAVAAALLTAMEHQHLGAALPLDH
eukprot:TRINITY_DN3738_c0_g2_i2.p1 TRINITY_DN3738_c0_g2~~TRINITY_DN3738_c0_g2_i2.p1  ORF type:complete len:490 (+),score=103.64 TRINITY_DN3738_c0_g2_i2:88-1557(+)